MATLEKIRSKSVLLVSVIFVALFLFIITIIDNPVSMFVDQTSVAKVKGDKIDYEQYQQKAQEIRDQNPENLNADEDALTALISETLFNQQYKALGITVTDNEITEAIVGDYANYQILQAFYQQFGAAPQAVLEAINADPSQTGLTAEQLDMLRSGYRKFEQQVEDFLKGQKLLMVASGSINANKLDAQADFDEANTSYTLATVSKSIYSVTDSVTDADIQKYYNDHKAEFKLNQPSRYLKYVTLDITPSTADRQKAQQTVSDALAEISAAESIDPLTGNSAFVINRYNGDETVVKNAQINNLQAFLDTAAPGQAQIIVAQAYTPRNPHITIARLNSRQNKVNGARIKRAVIDPSASVDSVIAALNAPGAMADSINGVISVNTLVYTFSELPAVQVDSVRGANGKYVPLAMGNGYTVADAVDSLYAPVNVYDFATADYAIEPSRETLDGLNTRMRDFLIVASTADAFNDENAMQQGLSVNDALISPSSTSINGLDDSRGIVAWAMESKKGQVSRLYTDSKNTRLTAAAIADIYPGDYVPATFPAIRQQIEMEALNDKRAQTLIDQYTGKGNNLAEYQAAMEAQRIDTLQRVNLSSPRYAQLGSVRGHKPGDVVGPLRWNGSVVVYSIVDAQDGSMPFDQASASAKYQRQMQDFLFGQQRLSNTLLGNGKIDNRLLRFTRQ